MLPVFLAPGSRRRRPLVPAAWRHRYHRWRRWRRRPAVYWTTVTAVALVAGLSAARVTAHAEAAATRYGAMVMVPVAARGVAVGSTVGSADVRWRRMPRAFVPGARPARHPAGRVAVAALVPGEVVVEDRLAPSGLHGAAALVPSGWRALAVPAGPGTPRVGRGDRVDLLSVVADEAGPSSAVAERALVVEVGDQAITVAVASRDAPAVAAALARGTVTVALVGAP